MEKFTTLRDIDNMMSKNFDMVKEYNIYPLRSTIIAECINENLDSIESIYKYIDGSWRLSREKIFINTDKYRSTGFNFMVNADYDYKADNFITRFDKTVSIPSLHSSDTPWMTLPKYISMTNPKECRYTLSEYDPKDVYYYFGDKDSIFKDFEDIMGVSVSKTYIIARKGKPVMTIDYTDEFDNKRVAKIEIFDEKKIIYFVRKNIMGNFVLDTTTYEYEIDESLAPLMNKRVIAINDTPVMANYDHYFAPKTFNGQDTYLGEIDHSDGEENFTIKSYLYKACLFENRDLIYYEDNNIYYLDQIVINDYNIEIDHIKRYLLIAK